jgi:site-specific recombinase XerD
VLLGSSIIPTWTGRQHGPLNCAGLVAPTRDRVDRDRTNGVSPVVAVAPPEVVDHQRHASTIALSDFVRPTEDDVERYIARQREKGKLAPKTIRNDLGVLHSIFELGRRRKWCSNNAVALADGPVVRRNETDIRFLTPEEVNALRRTTYPDHDLGSIEPVLYRTAAMTGLRQS